MDDACGHHARYLYRRCCYTVDWIRGDRPCSWKLRRCNRSPHDGFAHLVGCGRTAVVTSAMSEAISKMGWCRGAWDASDFSDCEATLISSRCIAACLQIDVGQDSPLEARLT